MSDDSSGGYREAPGTDPPEAPAGSPSSVRTDRPGGTADDTAEPTRVTRRTALKVLAVAAAAPAAACADDGPPPPPAVHAAGTLADPDLVTPTVPWDGVLDAQEMRTLSALCDVIIPADDRSPSASAVGVPDFINEWVSAPYPAHERDLVRLRGGLAWLNTESGKRFGAAFAELDGEQKRAICDDIAYLPDADPALRGPAMFFDQVRDLTATGFYTTDEGMADLEYRGNVPLASFGGAPPEVLRRLGLA